MSIEEIYVKNIYDKIAHLFDKTRYRPWSCVEDFLNKVPVNSRISDIGCGNGKNMLYNKNFEWYGCDMSKNMVNLCRQKYLNVQHGNILAIPFQDNYFDYSICIAVLHHLSSIEKRKKGILELIRITKPGGQIFILVWALEQEKDSKRKFQKQNNLIPWKDKYGNIIGLRYYHVFKKKELQSLLPENIKIVKDFYEKGNWGIIIQKS